MATFCAKTMDYRGLGTGIMRAMKEERDLQLENDEGREFKAIITRPQDARAIPGYLRSNPVERSCGDMEDIGWKAEEPVILPPIEMDERHRLLRFCRGTFKGMLEMMEAMGYKSRTSFRRKLLVPLLKAGLLELELLLVPALLVLPRRTVAATRPLAAVADGLSGVD